MPLQPPGTLQETARKGGCVDSENIRRRAGGFDAGPAHRGRPGDSLEGIGVSRASWDAATTVQRAQAVAYADVVDRIPSLGRLSLRVGESSTPHLDRLSSSASGSAAHEAAAAVFTVAITMVGRAHAADAADDLIRLAPEVHARRMSPLDVRNIALARAARAAHAAKATDLVRGNDQADVFDRCSNVVPGSPMLSPELIETITRYAERLYGRPLTDTMRTRLEQGLPCAIELIESYPGHAPEAGAVLVSMQARQSGREHRHLPTLFRAMGMPDRVATALTRILVGCGRDPQTAILWHALRGTPLDSVSPLTVARVRRDISDLDQSQFADDLDRARLRRQINTEVRKQSSSADPAGPAPRQHAIGK